MANNIASLEIAESRIVTFNVAFSYSWASNIRAYDEIVKRATPQGITVSLSSSNADLIMTYPVSYDAILHSQLQYFIEAKNRSEQIVRDPVRFYAENHDKSFWTNGGIYDANNCWAGFAASTLSFGTESNYSILTKTDSGLVSTTLHTNRSWVNTGAVSYQITALYMSHYFVLSI